jgi:hypothetical protein
MTYFSDRLVLGYNKVLLSFSMSCFPHNAENENNPRATIYTSLTVPDVPLDFEVIIIQTYTATRLSSPWNKQSSHPNISPKIFKTNSHLNLPLPNSRQLCTASDVYNTLKHLPRLACWSFLMIKLLKSGRPNNHTFKSAVYNDCRLIFILALKTT